MKKIIAYLTAIAIVFDLFTPLRLYFSGGKALLMLMPTVAVFINDGLFYKKSFLPLVLYVGAVLAIYLFGSVYYNIPFILTVMFAFACFEHYMTTRDENFAKIVLTTLYATLVVMVVTSLPLFISTPNLSRIMINAEENGVTSPLFYWTLSYPAIHSLPIYSIPVFYMYRNANKKWLRFASLLFIAAIFVLMLYADSTGALFINVGIFGILLLYNQKKSLQSNIAKLSALGVVMLVFLNKRVLTGILYAVQPVFSGSSTYKKIDEIIYMINGGDATGDMEGREEKWNLSWNSFVENPFFPNIEKISYERIGGHNFLFDQIVAMGLLLGVLFIWFLIDRIKRPLKHLSIAAKPYYLVGVLAFLVMGAMKNFFLLFPTCCILPMFLISSEKQLINTQR